MTAQQLLTLAEIIRHEDFVWPKDTPVRIGLVTPFPERDNPHHVRAYVVQDDPVEVPSLELALTVMSDHWRDDFIELLKVAMEFAWQKGRS